ncbi:MAG: hypothetical protein Q4P66_10125, partial [Actinomycetaceae bacterium]|nr:hypothetical protein [Actinomycetaceae bacterium]
MKNTIDTVYSRCAQLSRTGVGVLVASVMVLLMTVVSLPGLSVADPHTDKDAVRVAQQALPVVESPVGHQSQITAGDNTIAVPTDHAKDSSALIRVTIMPDKDIVLSSGDSPFLTSSAVGEPVSAVTFLPITEGKVSFSSTVDAQARVEVLATFNEDKYQAGTVVLADKPVTIVDSHNDLGMPQLTATPTRVVANGLVSPKGTGFILARVTANLSSAGDVTISGQQLA